MVPVQSIKKNHLSKLPEEALRLIGMGKYTLYRVQSKTDPGICYVLRTGEREFFFLQNDGEPVCFDSSIKFDIQEKLVIEDISITSVVPNFSRL